MAELDGLSKSMRDVMLQGALCRSQLKEFEKSLTEIERTAANARNGRGTWEDVQKAVSESTNLSKALREPGLRLENALQGLRTEIDNHEDKMEQARQNLETAKKTVEIGDELVQLVGDARVLAPVK